MAFSFIIILWKNGNIFLPLCGHCRRKIDKGTFHTIQDFELVNASNWKQLNYGILRVQVLHTLSSTICLSTAAKTGFLFIHACVGISKNRMWPFLSVRFSLFVWVFIAHLLFLVSSPVFVAFFWPLVDDFCTCSLKRLHNMKWNEILKNKFFPHSSIHNNSNTHEQLTHRQI